MEWNERKKASEHGRDDRGSCSTRMARRQQTGERRR